MRDAGPADPRAWARPSRKKIEEFLERGSFRQLDDLRSEVPDGVRRLTKIPTLGPKKALFLFQELGIDSPTPWRQPSRRAGSRALKGFGAKTEENILKGIAQMAETRVHLGVAAELADKVMASIDAERIAFAGSFRRMRDTIGDIDILAVGSPELMETFAHQPYVTEVIARGEKKTSIRDRSGHPGRSPAGPGGVVGGRAHLLHRVEGAQRPPARDVREEGVEALRIRPVRRRRPGDRRRDRRGHLRRSRDGVDPPTLREDGGEIQAALRHELPRLVTLDDLKGDLHTHTDLTDGIATLEDMLAAAARRGYAYYAVTDHAPDLVMQRMTLDKALAQRARLNELQKSYPDMRLLHGSELNIAPDGSVDWPEDVLAGFDVCVASVHSHFNQSRDEMTRRFIAACENPQVDIIGHPTTRKIGRRPGVDADWDAVFRAAARTGTALEIDAYPDRADLPSDLVRLARHHGVKFSIDSDSHAIPHLDNQKFGVGIAQRGWLTPDDVINTWPLDRLLHFLGR